MVRRRHVGLLLRIVSAAALAVAGWRVAAGVSDVAGYAVVGLGGLVLLFFVLSLIEVLRFGAGEPQDVLIPYQTRVFVVVVAALVALVAGLRVLIGGGTGDRVVAVVAVAVGASAAAAVVSSWRTRVGRRRWARAHGYTYRRCDPALVGRLGWPDTLPCAGHVVTGTYRDRALLVFDCVQQRSRQTMLVLDLPAAVPRLAAGATADGGSRLLAGTAPSWTGRAGAVVEAADRHHPWAFTADGRTVWAKYDEILSPSAWDLDRRLDGLDKVGTALTAPPPPARS